MIRQLSGLKNSMFRLGFIFLSLVFFSACGNLSEPLSTPETDQNTGSTPTPSQTPSPTPYAPYVMDEGNPDYREAMRQWVMDIANTAREADPDFIIIPQNGSPLLTDTGTADGQPAYPFVDIIDGLGRESLCFGEGGYGIKTSERIRRDISGRLTLARTLGLSVLSIDYCQRDSQVAFSQDFNTENDFIGFAASDLELTELPTLADDRTNANDILKLSDAQNFLVLLNPENYAYKADFLEALSQTNYDVIIMDSEFNEKGAYTHEEIEGLKKKANGGQRLVISYLSIGEAEDYRSYWQVAWYDNPPDWMLHENRNWDGNYIVRYWREAWQDIILYAPDSMTNRILQAGFDGVYLDIVDGYEYFESIEEE